ncbi:hypothetical protein AB0E70_24405 [Streptomyces murinus]|nr:hypothetical protein [Streptomyces murinus]
MSVFADRGRPTPGRPRSASKVAAGKDTQPVAALERRETPHSATAA